MKQHDRLMNALAEIKSICSKHEDFDLGCGKKCPFLMGNEGDTFRPCEVMRYVHAVYYDTPQDWGELEIEG